MRKAIIISDSLWPACSNSIYLALSKPALNSPPVSLFSPLFATASHSERICVYGTISSRRLLNISIGVVAGIRGILDAESHFWWQRKEKGPRRGRAWGTSSGSEVKVFSSIKASICQSDSSINNGGDRTKHTLRGFLLAKSIATAPPMDCPNRT